MPLLVGQASFTLPQIDAMDARLDANADYVVTNSKVGFYGDGNLIKNGAEIFLNEEQSTGYANRWTWMSTAIPIVDYGAGPYEPVPNNSPCGSNTYCVEYIHYAALLSLIWNGRSDVVTFSGETKTKDAHAQDLAEAVWDVLVQQHNEPTLDFSDTSRWVRNSSDGNPHFIAASKMGKYMNSYAYIQPQITGYASYITNVDSVESWFSEAAAFSYARARNRINSNFGGYTLDTMTFPDTTVYAPGGNIGGYVWFTDTGVGQLQTTWAQAGGINNRMLDFAAVVGIYGTLFNNTTYKDFVWDVFRLVLQVGVYSDGSYNEWYRASDNDGDGATTDTGINYSLLSIQKLVAMAYQHAVGVENGLTGLTDRGKFYDYETSIGSTELYGGGWPTTSTSGGPKSLKLVLNNLGRYYRGVADGGFIGVRYGQGGDTILIEKRPFTQIVAQANTYYNDTELKDYYLFNPSAGYVLSNNYYNNGGTGLASFGPYGEHSVGVSWGDSGSSYGGYFGQSEFEDVVFSGTIVPVIPKRRKLLKMFYDV